jgi:hypothetical protein
MHSAFRLLILMVSLSPLFFAADNLVIRGAIAAYVALMAVIVACSLPAGEAAFLSGIIRLTALFAILPAAWMLIQILPLPFTSLEHPIWVSAEVALGQRLWGSISISPGDTLLALSRYFSAFGVFFVAAAVSIDRKRAEILLLSLAGITTFFALLLVVHDLGGFIFLGEISSTGPKASTFAATILSTILTSAMVICAIERYGTRRSRKQIGRPFLLIIIAAISALLISWIAIIFFTSKPAIFAALSGVCTFFLIMGFRRIGLRSRMGFALAGIVILLPLSVIAPELFAKAPDLSIRFVTDAHTSFMELAQRIITDTNWAGSGAGSFSALLPIYLDTTDPVAAVIAPTTAAGILIEFGRGAMWLAVMAALAAIAGLVRGALERGRDSFFPAAGASCAVALTLEAFFDASLSGSAIIVISTTILGLALVQSVSRTAH